MAENSKIEWTDATFNPWWGCVKVSPGCDNCYAERDAKRYSPGQTLWGEGSTRRTFGDSHWNEPLRWARRLPAKLGRRPRVFCASMADVFDKDAPKGARARLWDLIDATPELDWLILTKRVGNVGRMIPDRWSVSLPRHVWLGISVVNQEEADRDIPKLLQIKAHVRWLSIEPILGPVDLRLVYPGAAMATRVGIGLDWVVVGGESGPGARPMHPQWAYSLRDQCADARVPFFFKQWGEWVHYGNPDIEYDGTRVIFQTSDNQLFEDLHDGPMGVRVQADRPKLQQMNRVGKRAAGRELDGETYNEFPR